MPKITIEAPIYVCMFLVPRSIGTKNAVLLAKGTASFSGICPSCQ